MGSARNNTLLAKLAFADPDRKDPMHDAACAYVAYRSLDLYRKLISERQALLHHPGLFYDDGDYGFREYIGHPISRAKSAHEILIGKGDNAYRTTIGFADVVITGYRLIPEGINESFFAWHPCDTKLAIEVKWTETSVSDAIRQVSVYRDYTPWTWAIAAPWPINAEQKQALDSRDIKFVRLDRSKVVAFAQQQRATEAPAEVCI